MITGSQRQALAVAGVSRSTWHYRINPRRAVTDPVAHKDRAYASRIDAGARAEIVGHIQDSWKAGQSVDNAFAEAWDQGFMRASRRSWWRIAQQIPDQSPRPVRPAGRADTENQRHSAGETCPGRVRARSGMELGHHRSAYPVAG